MICKNCQKSLQPDYTYCPHCGARVVSRRITFRLLLSQLSDWLFNVDNSFTRTFKGLFLKPDKVIKGYLSGMRKKYMSPLSYLTISITLAGLLIFIIQKNFEGQIDFTGGASEINPEFSQKWMEIQFDFNAFFFFIYLPSLALPAYLFMNRVRFNFSEYIIVFVYILAHYSIITFPFGLASLLVDPEFYVSFNQVQAGFLLLYCLYVLQRLNGYKALAMAGRTLPYLLLTVVLFLTMIAGVMAVLFFTGVLDFQALQSAAV